MQLTALPAPRDSDRFSLGRTSDSKIPARFFGECKALGHSESIALEATRAHTVEARYMCREQRRFFR